MRRPKNKTMIRLLLYGLGAMFLYGYANRAFYVPSRGVPTPPLDPTLSIEEVRIPSGGGELSAWVFEPVDATPEQTVVFCHGNAGNLENHADFVTFLPRHGFRVLLFDYRGYGQSTGNSPTRESTFSDVLAAIDFTSARWGKPWLMGHSLGASLAITAAAERKDSLQGLVAMAPFTSYRAAARAVLGGNPVTYTLFWPLGFFVKRSYDPIDSIGKISPLPLLLVHGEEDEIIPPRMSQELFEKAGEPKQLLLVPGMSHNESIEMVGASHQKQVVEFMRPEQ
jgi:uncharacterized protein